MGTLPGLPPVMTAREHVIQASRLLARASRQGSFRRRSLDLQAAQVHASLAQAITSAGLLSAAERLGARMRVRGTGG